MMKKHIYKTMAAMLLLSLFSAPFSPAAKVHGAESEFLLQKDIGFRFDGTDWTYLGAFGQKMTGWVTGTDGNKYYLDPVTGKLHTGWLKADGNWYFLNTVSDGTKGKLMTGWQWIDGYCYYFDLTGKMLVGTTTPDGYYVNANGQWAESDGTVHFISGKGFDTVNVLGAARIIPVTSRIVTGSSGGSGSSGSSSSGGGKQDSGKEATNQKEKAKKNESEENKGKESQQGTKTESASKDNPDSKPETKSESGSNDKPGSNPDDNKKDPESKSDTKGDVKVSGFKAMKPLKIPYQGDHDSTIEFAKKKLKNSGVTFYLSNGKRTTAVVTDWKIDGDAEVGNTIVAKAESFKISDSYKDIKAQFEKLDIEEKINIVKGSSSQTEETSAPEETTKAPAEEETTAAPTEEETTAAPENQHPDNWAITGYIQPEALELDYTDSSLSSYKQYFPKTVSYKTNDGTIITIDAKWSTGYDTLRDGLKPGGEITVRCNNDFTDFPADIRKQISFDSFDSAGTPTLTIKFRKKESGADQKEVTISLDKEPAVKSSSYDQYKYDFQDDITITLQDYEGDGSDVEIIGTKGFSSTLDKLSFNEETGTVTISMKDLLPKGIDSYFWLNIKIKGVMKFQSQIYVTTDRSLSFRDKGSGSVTYSGVSKKKDFVTTISFVNVPEKDIENISMRSGNEELKDKFSLTKTSEERVYEFRIPADYIKKAGYGSISFTIYCEGVFPVSVRLYTMPDPSLTVDKSSGCYAADDHRIKLNNFSFEKTAIEDIRIKLTDSDKKERTLVKGTDYKLDSSSKSVTLISSSILGTNSLDEDKVFEVLVEAEADEESAKTSIRYKKDRAANVKLLDTVIPYAPVHLKIENLEYGETYDDTEIYAGDEKLNGWSVVYRNYSNQIELPYEIIEKYVTDGTAKFTIRKPRFKTSDFTIVIPDYSGESAPVETAYTNEYGTKFSLQDDKYPVFSGTGSVYLKVTDKEISDDILKTAVGVFRKKGEDIKTGVPVYLSAYYGIVSSYPAKEKWLSFSLYSYKDNLGDEIVKDGDKYPVYTITVYIPGYEPVDIDVALKPSQAY